MKTMKLLKTIPWLAVVSLLALESTHASPAKTPGTNVDTNAFRSVYDIPTSLKDGRDPFFPNSTRTVIVQKPIETTNKVVDISAQLKCFGTSGTPGHMLAIINNHSFRANEEGDVLSLSSPSKIHLRCMDIQLDVVTVEVNGQIYPLPIETSAMPLNE